LFVFIVLFGTAAPAFRAQSARPSLSHGEIALIRKIEDRIMAPCCYTQTIRDDDSQVAEGMREEGTSFSSISPKCPFLPFSTGAVHADKFLPEDSRVLDFQIVIQSATVPMNSANIKVLLQYAYPKRGPPNPLLKPLNSLRNGSV
jgi:hypothetical protein